MANRVTGTAAEMAATFRTGAASAPTASTASAGDYLALLKPRVMSLVVFTGLVGLYLAPGDLHPVIAAVAVLCIAVGAGASGAINMWYDRDIDAIMTRTRDRPIPAGRIAPENALAFGTILSVASVSLMGLAVNWVAAALLALTIAFYVFVYTAWLKRRTPQNIVIGGAAGAVSFASVALFLLIFMWTPPHFWALALYRSDDYEKAGVPMLPVVAGARETRKQILIYTALLFPSALGPVAAGAAGWIYGVVALALTGWFFAAALRIWLERSEAAARSAFGISIVYLFAMFVALIADRALAGVIA